ncbi:MAG TPA: AMP-binding protein [Gemmataceae bacterium]|jgi:fatty-acyl-CoA synthase|nr:AMP-binding protein [Gemmataceae bacterium]
MPSLSYAHGSSSVPLLGETIGQNFAHTVERFGDREALVVRHQNFRATYRELADLVGLAARALLARGIKTGDRVGIWSPNRYEWVVLQYATARIGAILVNINPAYKATELEYSLCKSGVSFLALASRFRQTDYIATLAEVRSRCPALRVTLVFDTEWMAFLDEAAKVSEADVEAIEQRLQFDDAINIQYTSGTTGAPKGATLSHHNLLNNAYFTTGHMAYTEDDRVCVPVPFYHCFGMVIGNLGCTCRGACIVVPSESFDPLAVLETVAAERCTSLYGVPTMFIAALGHPRFDEFDLKSLRTGVMAGAPCPVELMRQVQTRMNMQGVTIVCGMTETSPSATQTTLDDPIEKRVETVGRPHPHAEIKIIDQTTGHVVPRGTPGEQCMRGYMVMLGYWEDREATAKAIDAAGWMHSGDLAVMDEDGYVRIVGRLKDMIIRGGENIYPREVEEYLHTVPGVAEAQVIGVPCPKYGEEVMAWVRLKDGHNLTGEHLRSACLGRIATYKIPAHWKFVDAFPMTVTGKVQKFRMREIAVAELGR